MEVGRNPIEMAIYAEIYYLRFEHYLTSLEKGEKPKEETINFFEENNLKVAEELFKELSGQVDIPVIQFARVGQHVIHHSLKSGRFLMEDFQEGVETHQEELLMGLDRMLSIKDKADDDYFLHKLNIEDMKDFFKDGYKRGQYQLTISSFLTSVNRHFRGTRDSISDNSKVVSLTDYRNRK